MSDALQVVHFESIGGPHEGITPTLLPDVFSSAESMNVVIDKLGRITSSKGYVVAHANSFSVAGGGPTATSTANVVGIHMHRDTQDGTVTRVMLIALDNGMDEWEVQRVALGDLPTAGTIFAAPYYASVGKIPDFAQFGNSTFITNGAVTPRAWNNTTGASVAGATRSPTPTIAISATPGDLTGIYQWKIVSVEADGTRGAGSVATEEVSLVDQQVTLSWTADANPEVVGYEIYRTLGVAKLYLLVDYTEGTTFEDNLLDSELEQHRALDEHGDPPPEGTYTMASHKGRMWWFRTDVEPTTGWYSDPGDPDSVYQAFNFIKFEDFDTQGDVLVGAVGNFGEQMVVFTERNVWTVSGTGSLITPFLRDWNKERNNTVTGAVSKKGILSVPLGARFRDQDNNPAEVKDRSLAYLTPLKDVRLFDGKSDQVISHPIRETLQRINYARRQWIHAVHDGVNGELIWFVPLDDATYPTHAIAWNYRWGAWYVRDTQPWACSTVTDTTSDPSVIYTGYAVRHSDTSGKVYRWGIGRLYDGAAITHTWVSQPLYGVVNIKNDLQPAQSYTKRFRWVDFLFDTTNPTTSGPTVSWFKGNAAEGYPAYGTKVIARSVEQGDFDILQSSDAHEILTVDSHQILVFKPRYQRKIRITDTNGIPLHDVALKLQVSGTSSDGGWTLEAFSLAYQTLEGTKRRAW